LGFKTFLLVELDVDEREHVMGLHAHTTYFLVLFETIRRHFFGQFMDFNCMTWVISLGLAKQQQLSIAHPSTHISPFSSPLAFHPRIGTFV
jgi:hypothetical protein